MSREKKGLRSGNGRFRPDRRDRQPAGTSSAGKRGSGNRSAERLAAGALSAGKTAGRSSAGIPSEGFARLQQGLTGDRALIGESYMDNPAMLKAYLDYYWPVSREQARYALSVCSRFAGNRPFRRIIDVGSGPAPVAAALIDAGAEEAVLVDQSPRALDLARAELPKRGCAAAISAVRADIASPDPGTISLWGQADCVSFGHSLNELFADSEDRIERRADLLARYAEALTPGGRILVIEPALLSTSRDLLAVRNLLVERGWTVEAPCPGRSRLPCPALGAGGTHTCHEEIEWTPPPGVASLARSMNLDKESLKMTWFLFAPPEPGKAPEPGKIPMADDRAEAFDRAGAVPDLYRVVSDPMLNKGGRIRRLICGRDGRFPLSAADGSPDAARTGFDRLRRGDFIGIANPEPRGNGWGIGPETVFTDLIFFCVSSS